MAEVSTVEVPRQERPALSASARRALLAIGDLLASGFTGKIELDCNQGGVREMREAKVHRLR